eukprot:snap_masked-scaffold_65-processed-gene-0.39-mRNA-1 protein AED:1.00 eAED:1.00 QI:0/-1/0/0/-1/1/1/0/88
MRWKEFSMSQSTWEFAVLRFKDITIMVVEFLKKENSGLSVERVEFLRTLFADNIHWNGMHMMKMKMQDSAFSSVQKNLTEDFKFVDTA